MGMQVRLVLYAPDEAAARRAATAAFAEVARLDAIFSDYRGDSEISALREHAGEPQRVSSELLAVLERAQELARRSSGAFDVTAAPITELWRRAIVDGELPAEEVIADARRRVGYERLRVDAAGGTVTLATGMALDLGGIAKGFVLDGALALLRGSGIDRALVEAGGDLVVGAAPPTADAWRVEVPHLGCVVDLVDGAIATSGDDFQFVEIDGVRYSHAVDPRTGYGLSDSRTATVVAPDGLTADGLATALTVVAAEEIDGLLAAYPGTRGLLAAADCR